MVTMHATLTGGVAETLAMEGSTDEAAGAEMPSTQSFQIDLSRHAVFKTDDPSVNYDITSKYKLGSGGFAKVFKVQRKSDQKVIALKFI